MKIKNLIQHIFKSTFEFFKHLYENKILNICTKLYDYISIESNFTVIYTVALALWSNQ